MNGPARHKDNENKERRKAKKAKEEFIGKGDLELSSRDSSWM